jgi:hypothetical protein
MVGKLLRKIEEIFSAEGILLTAAEIIQVMNNSCRHIVPEGI